MFVNVYYPYCFAAFCANNCFSLPELSTMIQDSRTHLPLDSFVDSPPLRVVSLLFKPASAGLSLLRYGDSARVDDVTAFPCAECGVDQLLIFLTAAAVCPDQRLPCSHHHLRDTHTQYMPKLH